MRSDALWPIAVMAEQIARVDIDERLLQQFSEMLPEPERFLRLIEATRSLARHAPALVKLLEAVERRTMVPGWSEQNPGVLELVVAAERVSTPLPSIVGEVAERVGLFWISGYWSPAGQWVYGRWEAKRPGHRWSGAHYEHDVFVDGCWVADPGHENQTTTSSE